MLAYATTFRVLFSYLALGLGHRLFGDAWYEERIGDAHRRNAVRVARIAFANAPEYWILVPKESSVKSAQDLKGKDIAVSQNTVIEYVTDRLLELEGLAFGSALLASR